MAYLLGRDNPDITYNFNLHIIIFSCENRMKMQSLADRHVPSAISISMEEGGMDFGEELQVLPYKEINTVFVT